MAIMTRMRDSMPTILFLLLIAFLITIIFEWGMDYTGLRASGTDVIGVVNGEEILAREFFEILRNHTDNQRLQTGEELTDDQLTQARDQVWQTMIQRGLLEQEIEKMGVVVSDQEIIDWVKGDNPPEDLRGNFVDSAGQFRRDLYEQFLANPNEMIPDPEGVDPQFGTKWLANYEQFLRERRAQEKLQSLVTASIFVSEEEVREQYIDRNINYNFEYALFDAIRLIPDSVVQVTDDNLRDYYNNNLDRYKVGATRTVKYVHFKEVASGTDSADVRFLMESLAERARNGEDFFDLINMYDESPDSGTTFSRGEMTAGLEEAAFSARVGNVVGPVLEQDGFHLLKILDEKPSDKEVAHASHILFSLDATKDSVEVRTRVDSVAAAAKGGADFSALAMAYSDDPGSGRNGGDLGWFGKGRMVKPFEDAVFGARLDQIVGPIRTQFGWHLIKVHARDRRDITVADIHIPIVASSQTINDVFDLSADFAYNARESEFTREAESMGFVVRDADIRDRGNVIPGLGASEPVSSWAFRSGVGDISDPFTIADGYAIFTVVGTRDEGIRPFEEVKENLRGPALREMKIDYAVELARDFKSQLSSGDSLSSLQSLDPNITVQKVGPITLSGSIPGIGRDPVLRGTIAGLEEGQLSEPARGARGAYIVHLFTRDSFDSTAFDSQKEGLKLQLLQDRRNQFFGEWLAKLEETADIEDNRSLFR